MSDARKDAADRFRRLIDQTQSLARAEVTESGLPDDHALLAMWQCERLGFTYADYHQHKRYRKALDFFLTDIYGPVDFSQRDKDIARVYPIMVKMLSVTAIESLAQAMELQALSMELDRELADTLVGKLGLDVAQGTPGLTPQMYAEGYRLCDNRARRVRQIELAVEAATILENAVRTKMVYMTVKIARRPAKAAGFGELQSFLERGLSAFKQMKGSHRFLDAMRAREHVVLEALFDAAPVDAWYGDVLQTVVPVDG